MKLLAVLIIGYLSVSPLYASDVFQWTDDNGVVNYSQWAPHDVDGVTVVRTAQNNPDDYDPGADPYSIQMQAERINDTWKSLEERKAERRKRRDEERERLARMQPPAYYYPSYPYRYYAPIYRPPIYRPVHPVHPVQPVYPGHKIPYVRKVQHHQVAALKKYNMPPGQRVPYSPVTGVSQRATIQQMPGLSQRGH